MLAVKGFCSIFYFAVVSDTSLLSGYSTSLCSSGLSSTSIGSISTSPVFLSWLVSWSSRVPSDRQTVLLLVMCCSCCWPPQVLHHHRYFRRRFCVSCHGYHREQSLHKLRSRSLKLHRQRQGPCLFFLARSSNQIASSSLPQPPR